MKQTIEPFGQYIAVHLSQSTAEKYMASAEKFVAWCELQDWFTWEDLPRSAVRDYCTALIEADYRPATVQAQLAGVSRFLKWARVQEHKLVEFHPAEIPRKHHQVKDALSPELLGHYFRLADELEEPARTAVMLLPCSALRGGELVSLPLNCLRRVPLKLKDGTEKETLTLVVKGKGGNERIVPLLDEGSQVIVGYLKGWRRGNSDTDWLFPGRNGHMADRTLRSAVQQIREPLKLRFTAHTMRRTYLTSLYRKGVDPVTLAKIAGHSDVKTLMTHYLALDEVDLAGAVHNTGGRLTA